MLSLLVWIFLVYSFAGWIYERVFFGKKNPDGVFKKLFNVEIPFLPIYGVGGVLLLLIYLLQIPFWTKVVISILVLNTMECIAGLISYQFHGYQTWNYSSQLCYGYISLGSAIVWTIGSIWFFLIADRYTNLM